MVRPTRVERLRARRARRAKRRAAVAGAAVTITATLVLSLHAGPLPARAGGLAAGASAGELQLQVQTSAASAGVAARARRAGMGVWVVEGISERMVRQLEADAGYGAAYGFPIDRVRAVDVAWQGKVTGVLTNAATVGELLSAMGMSPDRDDRVVPPPQTPISTVHLVRYARVEVRDVTESVGISHGVEIVHSSALAPGTSKVLRAGRDGVVERTWRIRTMDGRVVDRALVSSRTLVVPVAEVLEVGPAVATDYRVGEASWYWHSGLTAASPWLPFGTVVHVTNLANGKTVTVVIDDRGPFGGRIIDLSNEAFARIASLSQGVAQVRITW